MRVLRDCGLVASQVDGRRRLYELSADGFAELERWLAPCVRLWRDSLDALQAHLDETE